MGSTTELSQLLKLPVLVEHYKEHKAKDSDLTFWDFMCLHYNQEFAHDNTDNKLPFKSHSSCVSMPVIAFSTPQFTLNLEKPIFFEPKILSVFHNIIFKSLVVSTIWQPPRA